jgi:hypothetical protein
MKTKTITQLGYLIKGHTMVTLWGGDTGYIGFRENIILLEDFSKESLLGCINDNGFGVQSFNNAEINIYDIYEGGLTEFNRTIMVEYPEHLKFACKGIKKKSNTFVKS